jgi:hypothetical protein
MAAPTEQYQASDLAQIVRGLYYIDPESVRPSEIGQISVRSITCRQQIWKGTGGTDGSLRLSFRRCAMKGYLGAVSKHISSDNRFSAQADPPGGGGCGSWFDHSGGAILHST